MRISDWSSDVCSSDLSCGSWNDVIELRNDSASSWTDAMRDSRDCVRPEATPGMACTDPVLRVLLDCPTSRLETPAASTTCHDPAAPEYDDSPSNEGILECPEHACTSRRLPQPRRSFSLPAALPDRKSVVEGKSVSVRVETGGSR